MKNFRFFIQREKDYLKALRSNTTWVLICITFLIIISSGCSSKSDMDISNEVVIDQVPQKIESQEEVNTEINFQPPKVVEEKVPDIVLNEAVEEPQEISVTEVDKKEDVPKRVPEVEKKPELTGEFKKFEAKDTNGNMVNETIISEVQLTVINIWGTFCSPCIEEMPLLAELSEEYKEKGVQIIGIVVDADSDKKEETARTIIEKTKANYIHLLPSESLNEIYLKNVYYIPETLFIDNTGKIIESKIGAMNKDSWKEIIDTNLEKVKNSEN